MHAICCAHTIIPDFMILISLVECTKQEQSAAYIYYSTDKHLNICNSWYETLNIWIDWYTGEINTDSVVAGSKLLYVDKFCSEYAKHLVTAITCFLSLYLKLDYHTKKQRRSHFLACSTTILAADFSTFYLINLNLYCCWENTQTLIWECTCHSFCSCSCRRLHLQLTIISFTWNIFGFSLTSWFISQA